MAKIIDFSELLKIKDKDHFNELVNDIIDNLSEHYDQKIDVYTMFLERIKDTDIDDENAISNAYDEMININEEIKDSMKKLKGIIEKL
jgi:uncharacterized protein YllA (UPF0747 family)